MSIKNAEVSPLFVVEQYCKVPIFRFNMLQDSVFINSYQKGFSSIQRQLGLKRYDPVWTIVYKLRKAMENRDDRYTLESMIEMDEGYLFIQTPEQEPQT